MGLCTSSDELQTENVTGPTIQLDKSMVERRTQSGSGLVIALMGFCQQQEFFVTAEGVETKEQA